jgi:hypothetical protein
MNLEEFINEYSNTEIKNDYIYKRFTELVGSVEFLAEHRNYIEENKLGFGDRAFHYMWYLVLDYLFRSRSKPSLLEIGVYKGQVISLWSLIAKQLNQESDISCITPLTGNKAPRSKFLYYLKYLTSKKFRSSSRSGNFYEDEDFYKIIVSLYDQFDIPALFNLYRGLSTDKKILTELKLKKYDLVYIDGDHRRHIVEQDIKNFAPKINYGGFLVMDDAAYYLPGGENNLYWKGHQSVSDACEIIPAFGFVNVLNVGHNRIYQRK